MAATKADPSTAEAAEKALRFIFQSPHALKFKRSQITLDAAVFAFRALIKVDKASRASMGFFKLWSPVPVRSWGAIPKLFVKAVNAALKDPRQYKASPIGRTVAITHRRNLQAHLDMPDVMPCPQFK
jgi:hypothetical protein